MTLSEALVLLMEWVLVIAVHEAGHYFASWLLYKKKPKLVFKWYIIELHDMKGNLHKPIQYEYMVALIGVMAGWITLIYLPIGQVFSNFLIYLMMSVFDIITICQIFPFLFKKKISRKEAYLERIKAFRKLINDAE